ncbi:MAG: thioredoxin family protein [Planctomycetes bacterium]|nr:thioredoxin family protein [Planctomycetota bacterium]
MLSKLVACGLIFLVAAATIRAGEYNQMLNYGDAAPAWSNLPGVDGKQHSLADLKDKQLVVVVFTCNSCPVAVDYQDRIIAFAKKHAGPNDPVAVVAINVNKIEADSLPRMKERAEEKGFPFPYLFDETQKIARDYGATYTPEFFVLNKDRKVVYMGGMDDSSNPATVTTNYLEPAVAAALRGEKPATVETVARGCTIRYERERRKKK